MSDEIKCRSLWNPIQIQAVMHPGDSNCGPHTMLFALEQDGKIWVRYFSSGRSNVPTDGLWYQINHPDPEDGREGE